MNVNPLIRALDDRSGGVESSQDDFTEVEHTFGSLKEAQMWLGITDRGGAGGEV